MRVLAISGSLQARSANSALTRCLAAAAPAGTAIVDWTDLGLVPPFNPDWPDDDPPASVSQLRAAVAAADVVVVATPEYAGGMPGTLKNAFDWLVGTGELHGKPVVIVSAAPSVERGHNGRRWVEETLGMHGARIAASFTVALRSPERCAAIASIVEPLLDVVLRAPQVALEG